MDELIPQPRQRRGIEALDKIKFPYHVRGNDYLDPRSLSTLEEVDEHLFDVEEDLAKVDAEFTFLFGTGSGAAFGVLAAELVRAFSDLGKQVNIWPAIVVALLFLFSGIAVTRREGQHIRTLQLLRRAYTWRRRELAKLTPPATDPQR